MGHTYFCPQCGEAFTITFWLSGSWIKYVTHLEQHLKNAK